MRERILELVITVSAASILAGCIAVPIPLLPGGDIYTTEQDIEDLVDKAASKNEVIEKLGTPLKYRLASMSYKACRESGGVGFLLIAVGGLGADFQEHRGETECFELQLDFDQDNKLLSYQKIQWQEESDYSKEDMILRDLGKQGDSIAQELWEQSTTFHTSRDEAIVKERDERERGIIQRELASGGYSQLAEAGDANAQYRLYFLEGRSRVKWLCRSADQGHVDARLGLAYLYRSGTYGFPQDYAHSYMWYRLSALGELKEEVDELIEKLKNPSFWNPIACSRGQACYIAKQIFDLQGILTPTGLGEADHILENWQPGQCERNLVEIRQHGNE